MICTTIIPTIGRDTLTRAVESALQQDIAPDLHEVVVVNDSGKPLSQQDWQRSPRVRVVETNRVGVSLALNVGLALARGEYVYILGDDDYLLPGGLGALLATAQATGCIPVAGIRVVDYGGSLLHEQKATVPRNPFALLAVGEILASSQMLLKREDVLRVGMFDPLMTVFEDRDLECRLALSKDFAALDHIVACLRVSTGPGSAFRHVDHVPYSRKVREKAFELPGALRRILDSAGPDPFMRGRVCRNYLFSAVLNLLARRFWTSVSRVCSACRVALFYPLFPKFWLGLVYRMRFDEQSRRIS